MVLTSSPPAACSAADGRPRPAHHGPAAHAAQPNESPPHRLLRPADVSLRCLSSPVDVPFPPLIKAVLLLSGQRPAATYRGQQHCTPPAVSTRPRQKPLRRVAHLRAHPRPAALSSRQSQNRRRPAPMARRVTTMLATGRRAPLQIAASSGVSELALAPSRQPRPRRRPSRTAREGVHLSLALSSARETRGRSASRRMARHRGQSRRSDHMLRLTCGLADAGGAFTYVERSEVLPTK